MIQGQDHSEFQPAPGITREQVGAQLERILSSQTFADSPRLQQFLRYVVDETLAGNAERIKGFTIASDVFQRTDPDDTQASTIVRVDAGRLRRLLGDYYQVEGRGDPVRIHIPKGAYVPSFEEAAIKETSGGPVDAVPDPASRQGQRRLPFIALATLIVAVLAVLALLTLRPTDSGNNETRSPSPAMQTKPAIAVLPFEDATTDGAGISVAAGLTEDIVTDLSVISSIDVIALTSVLPYRNREVSSDQIATELDVTHILRGSVRGNKDHLRVTTQLFDAVTGRKIWAERVDRDLDDELALQEELALRVVEGMAASFQHDERARLQKRYHHRNTEAYSLYKQAMNLANPPSDPRRLRVAGRVFNEVIEAAPDFVGGYAGAAYIHAFLVLWGHSENPQEDLQKTLSLADKAIAIDPEFGLTHTAVGFAHLVGRDFEKALIASSEAIRVHPNDPYVSAYHGFMFCANDKPEQGIPFAKRAIRLDPVFPRTPYRNILGLIYFHAGHHQKALDWFERSDALGGPRNPAMLAYRVATYALLGRDQEAQSILDLLNNHGGEFDWKEWLHRVYKNEQYAEQVLQPLRLLENKLD